VPGLRTFAFWLHLMAGVTAGVVVLIVSSCAPTRSRSPPRALFRAMTRWHRWRALDGASRPLGKAVTGLPISRFCSSRWADLSPGAAHLESSAVPPGDLVPRRPGGQGPRLQLAQRYRRLVGLAPGLALAWRRFRSWRRRWSAAVDAPESRAAW